MATRHTVKCWMSSVRDVAVFGMAIALGFSSFAIAGLKVTKADVEVARKTQAMTAQRVKELEKQLSATEENAQDSAAKAKAAKAELDEVEKSLTTSKADIDKRSKEQPALDKASSDADVYLEKLKAEVQKLEEQKDALEEKIDENSSSIVVPDMLIVPCADDPEKKAEEKAKKEAEAKEAAAEAKAKDMEEPGFWRKRALKKGAKPETTGETKWLEAWKKEEAAKAAKEAAEEKAEREAEAKAAAEKAKAEKEEAEAKAKAAAEKAKAEKEEAEAKAKAEKEEAARKAAEEKAEKELQAKEAAAKAKAKDLEEPGFWRKRALKKGEKPETTGEKNWLAQWQKENADKIAAEKKAAEEKAAAEAAEAAAEKAEKEAAIAAEKAEKEAAAKKAAAEAAAEKERLAKEAAAAKAEKEAAAKKAAAEAKAKDLEEPGFWRKRALKKGEKPETTGEKNWLAQWQKENAEKIAAEKAAREAKLAAERKANEAKIADEKARAEAIAQREKEEAEAKAKREKEEAERLAKEEAERKKREAEELKAKLNAEPSFWRKRALKQGEKPETPGEEKWVAKWKAEQEALAKAEAERAQKEKEAELAREKAEALREKEEAAAKAKEEAERLEREKKERLANENEPPGYFRQRAIKAGAKPETAGERKWYAEWQETEKERLAKELNEKAERERIVRLSRAELAKVDQALINKRKELEVAISGQKAKLEAKNTNAEELARSRKLYERATERIAQVRQDYQTKQKIADDYAKQLDTVQAELTTLKAEQVNRQEKINNLLDQVRKGTDFYIAAEAARNRYFTAKDKTEGLQDKLEEYTRLASENKNRIPDVKAAVEEATAVVVDAREAYESYRKKLYNDTKGADKIETEIIIIEANKKNKTRQEKELEPLAVEVAKAVKELRAAEKVAVQVYHDADFYAFSVRKTQRAIERNRKNLVRYKTEFEEAKKELEPWGTLDPLPPKVVDAEAGKK